MKRNMKKPLVFIMALMMMIMTVLPVSASQATSYTYTLDDNNERVRTQDAYLPDRTITNLGLKNPSDIIIDENNIMYICDTGNTRIVIYDLNSEKVLHIISGDDDIYKGTDFKGFTTPKGIFRTDDGTLYVADGGEKAVFKFDSNYNYLTAFETPTAPIFGDTNYEPSKVAVDKGGNIFIVSEGANTGIIQLSYTGEFLGYFTSNKTRLTPQQAFLKAIYTKEQEEKSALLNTAPPTFSNIYVDETGTVYTTSMGKGDDLLKKHSTNGGNMFQNAVAAHASLTDVSVDDRGIIYASDTTGYITVYTKSGELIFDFGANVKNLDISGLFSSLTTIATDNNYNIWTADGDKGYLQSFIPTDYAKTIYKALDEYENGEYAASLEDWSTVLRLNQMSVLAHNGVGKAYYNAEEYSDAMEHFEIAGNRNDYSNAFWEVRNEVIQNNLWWVMLIIFILIVVKVLIVLIDRKKVLKKKKRALGKKLKEVPVIGELGYAFKICKHPIDRYYDIRVGKNGSVIAASIIYIVFFIVYMIYKTSKGFIYQYTDIEDMDISAVVIGFFAIVILFVICNYLVTSITDGDGTFKQVYMIPAYGAIPALIAMIAVIIMSYGLTYNEAFILTVILIVGIGWSLVLVFQGLSTVHDYSFKETVVSLIITFVFMLIAAIVVLIVIIMWEQLSGFLITIGKEIIRNVTGK